MQPRTQPECFWTMPKSLESKLIEDYHLLSYDVLDSTNEEAKRLAGGGASHGAVIWAKRQQAGRGRMGREWVSAEGNLFVSILLSPECDLATCSQLSFVAAVAAAETLEGIVPDQQEIACKWPNDILLNGRKLGGILLESFTTQEPSGRECQWVVVGVGINIDSFPEHVMFPAACLRDAGVEIISAKIVLSRFIFNFISHYDAWVGAGFKPVQKAWQKRAYRLGHEVEVIIGEKKITGVFDGIDAAGRLLVRAESGAITGISAGDVFFKE
ncbi:MAG: biotin--[acetyl-CoA-carboxylase] ligase [Azospirillum brasilense]|nr:MAG: biotin--[acetyl-CoA-carboxylase] ligase [Azospirillum brasilense]